MLKGEIALVTGASRGIGRAILRALAAQGATAVGTATTQAGADGIGQALAEGGFEGFGLMLDVADPASVEAAVAAVTERVGAPTVLVNNAGITRDNLLMRMKDEEWDAVIETNLGSVYRMCKACLRSMTKARRGRIINISSVVGSMGNAGQTNYAAAKGGMMGFTRALAREVASRAITVNCIAPGLIETDMARAMTETQRAAVLAAVPLGRFGAPEEVAAAVVFLASPGAAYITGETLQVNGGMFMA